jgi:hypothetical protein
MLLLEGNQRHEDRRRRFTISPTVFFEILSSRAIQQYEMLNRSVLCHLSALWSLRARLNQQITAFLRNHRGVAVGRGHICIFCTGVGLRVK